MRTADQFKQEFDRLYQAVQVKQAELAELDREIDLHWLMRGMHADINSLKHMVRQLLFPTKLDGVVNPDVDKVLKEIRRGPRGEGPPKKKRRSLTRRKK